MEVKEEKTNSSTMQLCYSADNNMQDKTDTRIYFDTQINFSNITN